MNVHEATGFAPFTLMYGKDANLPTNFSTNLPDHTYVKYLQGLFSKLDNIHSLAHDRLLKAKQRFKKYYDRNANPKHFKVGSQVYLEINKRENKKFSPYYTGPYVLEELIGGRNALIRLGPTKTKIVHLDKLRLNAYPCMED